MDSLKNPILSVHMQFSVYLLPALPISFMFYFHNLGFLLLCPPLGALKCVYVQGMMYRYTNKERD